ncbi:MAG TPA: hypothetical protein VIF62_15040 [Labilithrix sp.]|jgi:hypothetical protein
MRRHIALAAFVALALVACKKPDASALRNDIAAQPPTPATSEPAPPPQAAAPAADTAATPPSTATPTPAAPPPAAAPRTTTASTVKSRARSFARSAPTMVRTSLAKSSAAPQTSTPPTTIAPAPAPNNANGGLDMHPYDGTTTPKVARADIDTKPYD